MEGRRRVGFQGWRPEGGLPNLKGGRAEISRFFSISRHNFHSFFTWESSRGLVSAVQGGTTQILCDPLRRVFSSCTAVLVKDTAQKHVINTSFDTHTMSVSTDTDNPKDTDPMWVSWPA